MIFPQLSNKSRYSFIKNYVFVISKTKFTKIRQIKIPDKRIFDAWFLLNKFLRKAQALRGVFLIYFPNIACYPFPRHSKRKSFLKNAINFQFSTFNFQFFCTFASKTHLYEKTTYINIPFRDAYGCSLSFHKL